MRYFLQTLLLLFIAFPVLAQKQSASGTNAVVEVRHNIYEKSFIQLDGNGGAGLLKQAILEAKPFVKNLGCDLELASEIESPGGKHYSFRQTLGGIPIYQAGIKANVTKSNRVMSFLNNLHGFSSSIPSFQHSSAAIENLIPGLYDEGHSDFKLVENEQCFYLENDQLRAVHHITYNSNTMMWEVLLDDGDLQEVLRRDLAAYRKPFNTTATDSSGTGMVFNPDPLTTSGQVYGGLYVDNNDADSPELNNQRIQVILQDINWTGTLFELKGPYVDLQDRESPTTPIATSATGDFNFTRSEQGFEDVMVYYHLDSFQRYVQGCGFMNLQNGPIIADPHGLNLQDNSHFVPSGNDSRLGFGEGGVDDAEDADVIIHEYGHALSYAGSPGTNSGVERQGLDEGIGDYFAASYSRGISYTFWKNTFTWDGHNEFWPGRSASDPTLYPPSSPNLYLYGSIWASTLMEVYDQIGKSASDKVVLQSLYGNASNMTLSDAALVIIDADSMLFGGAHYNQYQQAFCLRGILDGLMPGQNCWVASDRSTDYLVDWKAFPNPANDVIHLEILQQNTQNLNYEIRDLLGRSMRFGQFKGRETDIEVGDLAVGSYIVSISGSNGLRDAKRIVIAR